MCSCDEQPYPCSRCRHTSHDPDYFLSHLPDGEDQYEQAEERPAEYEVLGGR